MGNCYSATCVRDPLDSLYNFIMIEKGYPNSTTPKIKREALVSHTKNISIKTFFNEKVAN